MNISVEIVAAEGAKTCTKCGVAKPLLQFNDDRRGAHGKVAKCRDCQRQYRERNRQTLAESGRRYREQNREALKEIKRRYYEYNREAVSARKRQHRVDNHEAVVERERSYREGNREALIARSRRYYAENREAALNRQRQYYDNNRSARVRYTLLWCKANPEAARAAWAARRAARLNATPPWVNRAEIVAIYAEAARLAAETGIAHHVDHIVPLQNEFVCGLHVPWNLRAIPAGENLSKSNRLIQGDGADYFEECL